MIRDFLAWLIGFIWKRETSMSATITIDGIAFPVSDFENAIVALRDGIKSGKSPQQIIDILAPDLLPPVETVANYFCPGVGTGIELIAFVVKNSIPFWQLPQDEQNKIMDRQSDGGKLA
jgi:hypothetical protein